MSRARVVVVPGAAVSGYVRPAVEPPVPADGTSSWSRRRGRRAGRPTCSATGDLAARLARRRPDLLIGLSVGAQVAAAAATAASVPGLVLVGPTVDPACRSAARLIGRWLSGGRRESPRLGSGSDNCSKISTARLAQGLCRRNAMR